MKDFTVSVRKLTDEELMREACECTFNGESKQSLLSMYKSEHSPSRTQLFWVKLTNTPLFVATHLIRHHVGVVPYQLTCRDDKKQGGNVHFVDRIRRLVDDMISADLYFSKGGKYTSEVSNLFQESIDDLEWLAENADRHTPVKLGLCLNAQAFIDIAKMRMCNKASAETRLVFNRIREEVQKVDPSLAKLMVRKCVYRNGLCGEPQCCGFNSTEKFACELAEYLDNFTFKQKGLTPNH